MATVYSYVSWDGENLALTKAANKYAKKRKLKDSVIQEREGEKAKGCALTYNLVCMAGHSTVGLPVPVCARLLFQHGHSYQFCWL